MENMNEIAKPGDEFQMAKETGMFQALDYLAQRWVDERKCESFQEYIEYLKTWLDKKAPGAQFISLTKRPFTFTFEWENTTYKMYVKRDKIHLDAISVRKPDSQLV